MNERYAMYELTDHLSDDIEIKPIKKGKKGKKKKSLKHFFVPRRNRIKNYRKESKRYDVMMDKVEELIDTTVYS